MCTKIVTPLSEQDGGSVQPAINIILKDMVIRLMIEEGHGMVQNNDGHGVTVGNKCVFLVGNVVLLWWALDHLNIMRTSVLCIYILVQVYCRILSIIALAAIIEKCIQFPQHAIYSCGWGLEVYGTDHGQWLLWMETTQIIFCESV